MPGGALAGVDDMAEITQDDFNGLVHSVYQSALDPRHWSSFVEDLSLLLDRTLVCLQAHDSVARASLGVLSSQTDPDFLNAYDEYYAARNVWVPGLAQVSAGTVVQSEELVDRSDFVKTEFYNDYFSTQDLVAASAIMLKHNSERMLFLSGNLRSKDVERVRPQLTGVLDLLAPHITRSFELLRRLPSLLDGEAYAPEADVAGDAVFFIDQSGCISHTSQGGDALLHDNPAASIDRNGRLHLLDPRADAALQKALGAISRADYTRLRGDFMVRRAAGAPIHATIAPLRHKGQPTIFDQIFRDRPIAMLVLRSQATQPGSAGDIDGFGLTPAELSLAKAIAQGMSPREYADSRHISIHTVRSQLKTIFAKTETSRQNQLASLVLRGRDDWRQ